MTALRQPAFSEANVVAQATAPPTDPPADGDDDDAGLSGVYRVAKEFIATQLRDRATAPLIERALADAGFLSAGPDAIADAWTVLADVSGDVEREIQSLRSRMRPNAALVAICATRGEVGAAIRAGAFGGVQTPVIVEQLVGVVRSAIEARAARLQVANLTQQLDVQTHLASIWRISAGLAHEIGNPLAVATLGLTTLEQEVEALYAIRETLQTATRKRRRRGGDVAPAYPRGSRGGRGISRGRARRVIGVPRRSFAAQHADDVDA